MFRQISQAEGCGEEHGRPVEARGTRPEKPLLSYPGDDGHKCGHGDERGPQAADQLAWAIVRGVQAVEGFEDIADSGFPGVPLHQDVVLRRHFENRGMPGGVKGFPNLAGLGLDGVV